MPRQANQPNLDGSAFIEDLRVLHEKLTEYWDLLTDVTNPTEDNLKKVLDFLKGFKRGVDRLLSQLDDERSQGHCCGRFNLVLEGIQEAFEERRCLSKFIKYCQLSKSGTEMSDEDLDLRIRVADTLEDLARSLEREMAQECLRRLDFPDTRQRA